ncbi:MAG: FAD:protein FMN transferase [Myxococcales bacterium]
MIVGSTVSLFGAACERHRPPPSEVAPPASVKLEITAVEPPPSATPPEEIHFERPAMSTLVQMVAYTSRDLTKQNLDAAFEAAFVEITRLENLLSAWKASSDVGRLNRAAGEPVQVASETWEVIERALWASRVSDGAFDITFQAMSGLWRFGDAAESKPRIPSRTEIDRRRRLVDFRKLELDQTQHRVRLPAPMQLSLGGIAKGYIVDRAAQILKAKGVQSFFIRAGGDLLGFGRKPTGEPFRSGVQDPRGARGSYFATLDFSDHAFSTAGDYERSFVTNGRRYHHIIDPRTGSPATACRSVTVWADDALTADALDDAIFILGPERGLALVEQTPGIGAVIVDADNRVIVSKRLSDRLVVIRSPTDGV